MDEIIKLLEQIAELGTGHAWIPMSGVIVGLCVRLVKSDKLVAWFPITVPPQYRAWTAMLLGVIAGVLDKVIAGGSLASALVGGLMAALAAISGNELIVEPMNKFMASRKRMFPMAVLMLALPLAALPGCAALNKVPAVVSDIASDVIKDAQEAQQIISVLHSLATTFFLLHADPVTQAKVEQGFATAELAVNTALRAGTGAKAASDREYDLAFANFRTAYADLTMLLKSLGVISSDPAKMGAMKSAGGTLDVPEPKAARARVGS